MNIQAELSLYPLRTERLDTAICRFVEQLEAGGLKPEVGAMSTVVSGECHRVFSAVERAFDACGSEGNIVLVFKVSNACPECIHQNKELKRA